MRVSSFPDLDLIEIEIEQLTLLLSLHQDVMSVIQRYEKQIWHATNFRELQEGIQSLRKRWSAVPEEALVHRVVCDSIRDKLEGFNQKLGTLLRLAKPGMMMRRHWEKLEEILSIDLFNPSRPWNNQSRGITQGATSSSLSIPSGSQSVREPSYGGLASRDRIKFYLSPITIMQSRHYVRLLQRRVV